MTIGIYAIINTVNDKCYIGSANNIKTRWTAHRNLLKNNKHHSIHLQRAYNNHGVANFKYVILEEVTKEECVDVKYLIDLEQMYLDTYQPKYNILPRAGSRLGSVCSEEQKQRLRTLRLGVRPSEETRKLLSECHKGEKHHYYGKTFSEQHKKKLSDAKKGDKNPKHWEGKHRSDETKEKLRIANEKKIYKITTPDNEEIICTNIRKFARDNDINNSRLYEVLNGKTKEYKGYKVEKIGDINKEVLDA